MTNTTDSAEEVGNVRDMEKKITKYKEKKNEGKKKIQLICQN